MGIMKLMDTGSAGRYFGFHDDKQQIADSASAVCRPWQGVAAAPHAAARRGVGESGGSF